ncbi:elongation factor P maturation arginine rhamnosyltransferase EarP [Corticibacter populi]|uniref:elongation factor P maturation arginine rhamnosyltransferase EarP n=1 Tax=Corticibacter populi TaxID=1550736 RepID=UPI0010DDFBFD|nr:putative repeat protein (TIGR03837 family) [Corticibacter populi]
MRWDVFCQVIDNYGDAGVCWRLACDLAARGQTVRLWVDDATPLQWMGAAAATADGGAHFDAGAGRVEVLPWRRAQEGGAALQALGPPEVLIEAFGCEIPEAYLRHLASQRRDGGPGAAPRRWPRWLNLEYLSAEAYVERMHLLASPVMFGPAAGQTKTFFYPGFTERTGGLLREPGLLARRARFDVSAWRRARLAQAGLAHTIAEQDAETNSQAQWISLFSYELPGLPDWLQAWAASPRPVHLLAAAGRSQTHLKACWQALGWPQWQRAEGNAERADGAGLAWGRSGALTVHGLPFMPQAAFDELLWGCDANIVRGEDSLVRALWAGGPFLWHIYPQHDDAHHAKLAALLDWLQAPQDWRDCMFAFNGIGQASAAVPGGPAFDPQGRWRAALQAAQQRLLARPDLVTQLMAWLQRHPSP